MGLSEKQREVYARKLNALDRCFDWFNSYWALSGPAAAVHKAKLKAEIVYLIKTAIEQTADMTTEEMCEDCMQCTDRAVELNKVTRKFLARLHGNAAEKIKTALKSKGVYFSDKKGLQAALDEIGNILVEVSQIGFLAGRLSKTQGVADSSGRPVINAFLEQDENPVYFEQKSPGESGSFSLKPGAPAADDQTEKQKKKGDPSRFWNDVIEEISNRGQELDIFHDIRKSVIFKITDREKFLPFFQAYNKQALDFSQFPQNFLFGGFTFSFDRRIKTRRSKTARRQLSGSSGGRRSVKVGGRRLSEERRRIK